MSSIVNLVVEQGAFFSVDINLASSSGDALDVDAYVAAAQMRPWAGSNTSVSFSTTLTTGMVTLSMNASTTASLVDGRYVYDVNLTSGDVVLKVAHGLVTVLPGVTR